MALHVFNIHASHAFGQGRELRCAAAWGFRIGVWGDTNQLSAASGKVWQLVVNGTLIGHDGWAPAVPALQRSTTRQCVGKHLLGCVSGLQCLVIDIMDVWEAPSSQLSYTEFA
jgi:hypothetical protein